MRLLIHDYAGHPFQVQLSRELARRGYDVLHLYFGHNNTPKGDLEKRISDPDALTVESILTKKTIQKYSLIKRRSQEIEYGKIIAARITTFKPDFLISANTPLDAQMIIMRACRETGTKFIFWLQDVIGLAAMKLLSKKIPILGSLVGWYYIRLERRLLRASHQVILISEDFRPIMLKWQVASSLIKVIPNWAPVEEISPGVKNNPWAQQHALVDKFCFLYSGVLGMKHNPELLLKLAEHWRDQKSIQVVVVSEGPGVEWLKQQKRKLNLENLSILNFQPYEVYPSVLAAADVLVSILNPDAGLFSVPSKVLTYLCAQRPVLLAVPDENLVARIVNRNQTGLVVDPNNTDDFLNAATCLYENEELRAYYAKNGRQYAEKHFDIKQIADQFEQVIL